MVHMWLLSLALGRRFSHVRVSVPIEGTGRVSWVVAAWDVYHFVSGPRGELENGPSGGSCPVLVFFRPLLPRLAEQDRGVKLNGV